MSYIVLNPKSASERKKIIEALDKLGVSYRYEHGKVYSDNGFKSLRSSISEDESLAKIMNKEKTGKTVSRATVIKNLQNI